MQRRSEGAARVTFRRAETIPELKRVSAFWICKTYRAEQRDRQADECFQSAGIAENATGP